MSECPGYVNVKVNIWPSSAEYAPIVNHDVLISCPPSFSVSFALPLDGDDVTPSTVEDCILECVLEDGKNAHRLLLRPIFAAEQQPQAPIESTVTDGDDSGGMERRSEDFDLPTFGVAVLLAMSTTLTFVWLFSELFHLTKARRRGRRDRGRRNHRSSAAAALTSSSSPPSGVQLSDSVRRTFASVRVLMRLVYAFAFTFTVFTSLVGVALRQRVDPSPVTARSGQLTSDHDVEEDTAAAASSRSQTAPSCLVQSALELREVRPTLIRRSAAVADIIAPSINSVCAAAARWAQQTTDRFLTDVEVAVSKQRRYALMTSLNHWMMFPRALYNTTTTTATTAPAELNRHAPSSPPRPANSTSDDDEDAFWNFVQVMPSEVELSLWTANVRKR